MAGLLLMKVASSVGVVGLPNSSSLNSFNCGAPAPDLVSRSSIGLIIPTIGGTRPMREEISLALRNPDPELTNPLG
ncbi:hypothetical protein N7519_007890 [Penicillium mononematosum]|uniref:uncharacterized protein n=1 Tax=Penicillium mononematosum TaxID=268346 RepID=UPI002546ACE0|nr:uncharacterized protein N7519_007890 [Penicillium mononematosum]KAJ6186589.1 hypothetical protein N7519_007890 [Penicillium mononematosum]